MVFPSFQKTTFGTESRDLGEGGGRAGRGAVLGERGRIDEVAQAHAAAGTSGLSK